ncbi:glutamine synthetase beta-grasp domain-containing protein [uncultured Draconibacterium sp.]|uniref:glutamine synthetase beta-grasp domain-containing protein n=1 Tax=uncultured Draconibacterium sp. TaxID=1573823 RepID=UPI0029C7FA4A|nr:glutamine synthetase beta-grasp domain-containing protein [uncultured Draconibacterium sp.]
MKSKLEYIWLDGSVPTQQLRAKTRVADNFSGKLEDCPVWSFDGSSTNQAGGGASDLLLKPVFICPDPDRKNAYLVLTEVLNPDGTAHETNGRAHIEEEDEDFWFGYEQEYFLYDPQTRLPLGFPAGGFPEPQGPYYCGVGGSKSFGRAIVEEHFDICLEAGLNVEGINAEVAAGQWEFQIFAKGAHNAGDQIWMARFLLERTAEKYGVDVEWHPKPLGKDLDWNGSGMHANFSNGLMRTCGDEKVFNAICEEFGKHIKEHIDVYGAYNDQRLTGLHETAAITDFSYGVSDRGASIRIPVGTVEDGWKGRLEDRRPASNGDPYKIGARIIKTVHAAKI